MADIIPPSPLEPISNESGAMLQRFMNWTQDVSTSINSGVSGGSGSGAIWDGGDRISGLGLFDGGDRV